MALIVSISNSFCSPVAYLTYACIYMYGRAHDKFHEIAVAPVLLRDAAAGRKSSDCHV
jgi:hypothetical protein